MFEGYEERTADSPFVHRVWRCRSARGGSFLSIAAGQVEIVLARVRGGSVLTVRGPETTPARVEYPADAEWVGIQFSLGTFMPRLLPVLLRDRADVNLPDASSRSFWLNGSAVAYPTFEHAETFMARLARHGDILHDRRVEAAWRGDRRELAGTSVRSVQRHFLRATGLTVRTLRQIERAREAARLLRAGMPILDVVRQAGYYDQAHLTRSLTQRIGQTPTELQRARTQLSVNLSFRYKTPARL